jgi:hypothetical protein
MDNTPRFKEGWKGYLITNYLENRLMKKKLKEFEALPIIDVWGIWFAMNVDVLRGKPTPPFQCVFYRRVIFDSYKSPRQITLDPIDKFVAWVFLDGASQGSP